MANTLLFAINHEGRVFGLSTNGTKWREFIFLGLEFKHLSAVPHFLWAIGGDRQVYVHVHGLDIPIRIKEEAYENERWTPFDGFSKKLLPTDRGQFSNKDGMKDRTLKNIRLPSMAWQWEGDWHLELTLDGQPLDNDGWTYAVDFPATYHTKKQWSSCVRRRKWIRYRKYSALNSWCAIAPLHKDPTREPFLGISVGGNQLPGGKPGMMLVWAVTAHGRVMFRTDVSNFSPEGQRWSAITMPPGCEVSQVSVGPTGLVWVVLWSGKALVRTGVTKECLTGEGWIEVEQPGENLLTYQVSVGCNGLWAITRDNRIWFRKGIKGESSGVSEELAKGSGWVEVIGNMASVSVASNDQVWAVGAEDRLLYFRTAVTQEDLTGKTWRLIGAPTRLSRASSPTSLLSGEPASASPTGERHRCLTSLNRLSGSRESLIKTDFDFDDTCHSAPASPISIWQKSTDGTSLKSFGSPQGSDSSNVSTSLQDVNPYNVLENVPHPIDIVEEKSKEEEGKNNYEDSSHPVVSTEITKPTSPQHTGGTAIATEARNEVDSSIFESDEFAGVYNEHGEREEDDHFYWSDSEAFWASAEAGACLVNVNSLPNWFTENNTAQKIDLTKPWRTEILEVDLKQNEKAVDTSSHVKAGNAKCLIPGETTYADCMIELKWVTGGNDIVDCGTLTVSSLDKKDTWAQVNMRDIVGIVRCSEPCSPRLGIFKINISAPVRLQFSGEDDLEDWITQLSSVSCRVRNISGSPGCDSLWMTTALGDIFACDPAYISMDQRSSGDGNHSTELNVSNATMPFKMPLHAGFLPGSYVVIQGCVHDNAERFNVDLVCGNENGNPDIAFHLNPRFIEKAVVRNTKKNSVWGPEDRRGCQPFKPGALFEIKILCDTDFFSVFVDGKKFTDFALRELSPQEGPSSLTPAHVTHLGCNGDMSINKIQYSTPDVIIQPGSMFWRQIGGHLKKVESAGGITWGIGFDITAWVYMGGDGTDSSTNHKMTDGHNYHVYENQRWNPFSGYTSHGLPTDRFMWSDATGRYKRTMEKTKLMSKKWQWVNDWMVDFHIPGGVDKEGWQYAVDFPASYHGTKHLTDYVRRRRWIRRARLETEGPWIELDHTPLLDCSLHIDGDEIVGWAVAANGYVLYRRGVSKSCPAGLSWEHVASDQQMISISTAPGQVWTIGKSGTAFWRVGITSSNPLGDAWETVESPRGATLKQISIGEKGVWALDAKGRLSVRKEVTPVFPEGSHWQTLSLLAAEATTQDESGIPSTMMSIAAGGLRHVSAKSRLWAITSSGGLVQRVGVNSHNPAGATWSFGIEANCLHIST